MFNLPKDHHLSRTDFINSVGEIIRSTDYDLIIEAILHGLILHDTTFEKTIIGNIQYDRLHNQLSMSQHLNLFSCIYYLNEYGDTCSTRHVFRESFKNAELVAKRDIIYRLEH